MNSSPDHHSQGFPAPVWPQYPELLTSGSHCPSCFSPLGETRCGRCGLDLAMPLGADVLVASEKVAASLRERADLLTRMRIEQAAADAAAWAAQAVHVAQAAPLVHSAPVAQTPAYPVESAHPFHVERPVEFAHPVTPPVIAEPTKPRRSGVQIFLLGIGVVLVSIMAIFFVLLAYLVASIEVRSILTAIAAVAVFGLAWLLRSKNLTGTAEGIGALAVVLALLNIWLIRANDLFGSAQLNSSTYTGIAFLVLVALLLVAFRLTRLRVMSVAAAGLVPFGLYFLVAGVLHPALPVVAGWLGLLAAGASGLAWPRIRGFRAEALILRITAYTAASIGIFSALVGGEHVWAPSLIVAGFTALWALTAAVAHYYRPDPPTGLPSWLLVETTQPQTAQPQTAQPQTAQPTTVATGAVPRLVDAWVGYAAGAFGVFAAVTAVLAALATHESLPSIADANALVVAGSTSRAVGLAPLYIAVLGLGVSWFIARSESAGARRAGMVAALPLAVATGIALVPAVLAALAQFVVLLVWSPGSWPFTPSETLNETMAGNAWWALGGIIGTAALISVALLLLQTLRRFAVVPTALVTVGLLGIAASAGSAVGIALVLVMLSPAGLLALWRVPASRGIRLTLGMGLVAAALGTLGAGWLSAPVWPWAAAAAVAMLVALRLVLGAAGRRAGSPRSLVLLPGISGLAAALVFTALGWLTSWLITIEVLPAGANAVDRGFWPVAAAAGVLLLSAFAGPLLPRADVRAVSLVTLVVALIGTPILLMLNSTGAAGLIVGTTAGTIILALLVAAAVAWQLRHQVSGSAEALVLALAGPLALALLAHTVVGAYARVTDVVEVSQIVAAGAGLVAAAFAVAALRRRKFRTNRIVWDVATLLVTLLAVGAATVSGAGLGWLALLIAACVPLLIASGDGDLFTGSSGRRHIAWLSLPIAVGSLWQALLVREVTVVEWYTLPLAATLLAVAALIAWRRPGGVASSGRTALVIAGVAIAVVPSIVVSGDGTPWRPIILIAAGGLLAVSSLDLPPRFAGVPVRVVALVAGLLAVGVPGLLRGSATIGDVGAAGWQLEAWIAPGVVVAAIVTVVFALRNPVTGWSLPVLFPMALLVLPELNAAIARENSTVRILAVIAVLGATHVVAAVMAAGPLARVLRWASAAALALVGVVGLVFTAATPFELVTVPIAAAVFCSGVIRLRKDSTRRTWPELGVATAVLLVPSYLANFWVPPLWRVIGLGVLCIAILLFAVWRKWQSPLLIAGIVLVLHAIAQLWPWISAVYGALWWLWLGVGGVILIVIAATYEKRLRDFRSVATRIGELR